MSKSNMHEVTALRLRLLAQGRVVLRCNCKVPEYGWKTAAPCAADIMRWTRSSRYSTTGTRLGDDGLGMIDLDIKDQAAVDAVADAIVACVPALANTLIRYGGDAKEAWPVRVATPFGVHFSSRWRPPGSAPEEKGQRIELFGGKFPKFFALFGPHSRDERTGEVLCAYRWQDGVSLADTPLADLPLLVSGDTDIITKAADAALERLGWIMVPESRRGSSNGGWRHDLTGDEIFQCNDGADRSWDECAEHVERGWGELRCSASFTDPGATNRSRCRFGRSGIGTVFVIDHDTYAKHALKPVETDMNEVAEKLRRMQELRNA